MKQVEARWPGFTEYLNTHNNLLIAKCYTLSIPNLPPVPNAETKFYITSAHMDFTYPDDEGINRTFIHPTSNGTIPILLHDSFTVSRGLQVNELPLHIICGMNGRLPGYNTPIPLLAEQRCFDGAEITMEWAVMGPSGWGSIIGVAPMFDGRVSKIVSESHKVQLTISSEQERLQALNLPIHPFEAPCANGFGDANCGINLSLYTDSWTVTDTGGVEPSRTAFYSSCTKTDGYYNLGLIRFTSGVNKGISVACRKSNQINGKFQLATPLIVPPSPGDTFIATKGCPKSMTACANYGNKHRYRGTPYVPNPEAAL